MIIRAAGRDDFAEFHRCAAIAFHEKPSPEFLERQARIQELDRSFVVLDDDRIVGTSTAYSTHLSVPGGELPCAAISWLTVLPTHRRRGLLAKMIERLVEDARQRAEPLAALWSTTAGVYGRFGFGPAAWDIDFTIPAGGSLPRLSGPTGQRTTLELCEPAGALPNLHDLHQDIRRTRPGLISRTGDWWNCRILHQPDLRVLIARDPGGTPRGYALYTTHGDPPSAVVEVVELMATDLDAESALWRYLCSLELTSAVHAPHRPVDDLLPLLFDDIRRPTPCGPKDSLWLRLVDVPTALERRRWCRAVDVVLEVGDPAVPENHGRWRLRSTSQGTVECVRCEDPADLTLGVELLGMAYLGGMPLGRLAAAGMLAVHSARALTELNEALAASPAAWAPEHF